MSFTLILAEVLDFFQPLKYSINHNVFKIKVKCSFLILSKKRVLLFFWRSLDLEKALLGRVGIGVGATACETSTRIEATVRLFLLPFRPGGGGQTTPDPLLSDHSEKDLLIPQTW